MPTGRPLFDTGVAELDARYAFEFDDGAIIEIRDMGFRQAAPDILKKLASGADVPPQDYYMRTAGAADDWARGLCLDQSHAVCRHRRAAP